MLPEDCVAAVVGWMQQQHQSKKSTPRVSIVSTVNLLLFNESCRQSSNKLDLKRCAYWSYKQLYGKARSWGQVKLIDFPFSLMVMLFIWYFESLQHNTCSFILLLLHHCRYFKTERGIFSPLCIKILLVLSDCWRFPWRRTGLFPTFLPVAAVTQCTVVEESYAALRQSSRGTHTYWADLHMGTRLTDFCWHLVSSVLCHSEIESHCLWAHFTVFLCHCLLWAQFPACFLTPCTQTNHFQSSPPIVPCFVCSDNTAIHKIKSTVLLTTTSSRSFFSAPQSPVTPDHSPTPTHIPEGRLQVSEN